MPLKTVIYIILTFIVINAQEYGWLELNIVRNNELNSSSFISENTGWVAGGAGLGEQGIILFTNDGGWSWEKSQTGPVPNLFSIFFSDSLLGWACGYNGVILKTTSAGMTWSIDTLTFEGNECFLQSCFFINPELGFISGWEFNEYGSVNKPIILKTIDGGTKWFRTNIPNVKGKLFDCFFIDENLGFAIGGKQDDNHRGLILKTSDGGNSWTDSTISGVSVLYEMNFINDTLAYFVGEDEKNSISKVLVTHDRFISVSEIYSKSSLFLKSLHFKDELQGWICGSKILKTSDGGNSWKIEKESSGKIYMTMEFKGDNGWVFGYDWASGDGYSALYTELTDIRPKYKIIPNEHILFQNFPNPFNLNTEIIFHLSTYTHINLSVFDTNGRELIELINGYRKKGRYKIVFDGGYLSSGIYYYRLITGGESITKRMLLVK